MSNSRRQENEKYPNKIQQKGLQKDLTCSPDLEQIGRESEELSKQAKEINGILDEIKEKNTQKRNRKIILSVIIGIAIIVSLALPFAGFFVAGLFGIVMGIAAIAIVISIVEPFYRSREDNKSTTNTISSDRSLFDKFHKFKEKLQTFLNMFRKNDPQKIKKIDSKVDQVSEGMIELTRVGMKEQHGIKVDEQETIKTVEQTQQGLKSIQKKVGTVANSSLTLFTSDDLKPVFNRSPVDQTKQTQTP